MEWRPCDNEYYEIFIKHMNTPSVVVDSGSCSSATLVQVHSERKHGILLEAVAALTDYGASIHKGYIISDGSWFMHVFHVSDSSTGFKIQDPTSLLSLLESSLCFSDPPEKSKFSKKDLTLLELTGADRPGLLSEIFAVLHDFLCDTVDAKAWTHNGRIAALILVRDEKTFLPLDDSGRIRRIESKLKQVLKGENGIRGARMAVADGMMFCDRRLHQLLLEDRDYERGERTEDGFEKAVVSVQNGERGYSVVTVQCRDRPKLLFDVVCTLTDMEYVVCHGTFSTDHDRAQQEFYIRHLDGSPISCDTERQTVIRCLQAATERRASEGLRLELNILDRRGLLAYVTRIFREHGLSVTHAEITTKGDMARNVFYVTDAAGCPADLSTIEEVIQQIGRESLSVNKERRSRSCLSQDDASHGSIGLFSLGSLVRRNLYNLGLVKSCS